MLKENNGGLICCKQRQQQPKNVGQPVLNRGCENELPINTKQPLSKTVQALQKAVKSLDIEIFAFLKTCFNVAIFWGF